MLQISWYLMVSTLFLLFAAIGSYIAALTVGRDTRVAREHALVGAGAPASRADVEQPRPDHASSSNRLADYGTAFTRLAVAALTVSLITRSLATGHGPFANQYEFAVAFAWGMIASYAWFEWRYHIRTIALIVLPMACAMLLYAITVGDTAAPLVPALQNSLLLTVHVAVAVVAYGAFAVASGAAVLYLVQPYFPNLPLPKPAVLEDISYRAILIAFPLDTMVIILGALWADVAWGSYWSWDPKETASLVTWLIYGAYLHARVVRGWHGKRAAWLLLLGFSAVLLTFFGNLFFGGLHSYSGM